MKTFHVIDFGPFQTNVLDCVGRQDLVTATGVKVELRKHIDFTVIIGEDRHEGLGNIAASYILNTNQVGVLK